MGGNLGHLRRPRERYANQLIRCLKALDTRAPIRERVQHELAEVRAEQDTRARTGQPTAHRRYDVAGLTVDELERTRRELAASLALARPGSPVRTPIQVQMARHRRRDCRAGHTAHLNGAEILLCGARHDHLPSNPEHGHGNAVRAPSTGNHKYFEVIITVLIIYPMLMDAARWLRESGLTVEDLTPAGGTDAGVDAILEVETGDHSARFAVQAKSRAPYPHELERLQQSWHGLALCGHPLIVAPFISEPLGSILTRDGWSWADTQGNFDLRAPGLLLRQRRTSAPPAPKRKTLPRGSGSFAVIRALVGFSGGEDDEPGATALAAQAGVSQPRASQILHHLHELELVDRSGHGRWEPRREALLDRFLAEYPGPGGSEQYYYSLNSPVDVAVRAGRVSTPGRPIAASADVGPDLILPWRRPSLVILYIKHAIDPSGLGLTQAQGRHDANVIVRTPGDRSVFPTPALVAQVQGSDVPLADPLQQIWDLQDLGGADRIEAAGRLRQWLLERP